MKALFFAGCAALASLAASAAVGTAQGATPEPGLVAAIDQIWADERPALSRLDLRLDRVDDAATSFQSSDKSLAYTLVGTEEAAWTWRRRQYPATASPWGDLPRIDAEAADLYRMQFERKHYLVVSARAAGLFAAGSWSEYGFLHVIDTGTTSGQRVFPLVAPASLGVRVLGRLPKSPVLNYLRLVPAEWNEAGVATAWEALVYALGEKGPERVLDLVDRPLAFELRRRAETGAWTVRPVFETPVADAMDARQLPFVAAFAVRGEAPEEPEEAEEPAAEAEADPAGAAPDPLEAPTPAPAGEGGDHD